MVIHNNTFNTNSHSVHHGHRRQVEPQTDVQPQTDVSATSTSDLSSLPELASLFGKASGSNSEQYNSMVSTIMQMVMEMIGQLFGKGSGTEIAGDTDTTTNTDAAANTDNDNTADNHCGCDETPTEPPVTPEEPCTDEPPTTPTPPDTSNDVLGSAGLFGDPKFGVFTPNLGDIPEILKGFESGIKAGETQTLLSDPDEGGLDVSVTGTQVNPQDAASTGVGSANFKAGNDTVTIGGDGSLLVNGEDKGNINDLDSLAPITLDSGLTVGIDNEVDSADGTQAKRFVVSNGEYKITAAARKPDADAAGYLDMNFEELTPKAADNATGYRAPVEGLDGGVSLADLLNLEPGDLA